MLHETLSQERQPEMILVGAEQTNRQKLKGDRTPFNKETELSVIVKTGQEMEACLRRW